MQRSVRLGRDVWLCEPDAQTAAIPVWMTDRVACLLYVWLSAFLVWVVLTLVQR